MTPGRRAGIRGRRDGRRPLRSRPCLAWLGDPRRAGATGIHAGISDQALFPSTPDPCFPNTSPILRPSSSADFFPGGGRARMQRPPLGRPRGSRQAVALGPPPRQPRRRPERAGRAGPGRGARAPGGGPRALGAQQPAATPARPTAPDTSGLCRGVESLWPPQSGHRSRITASRARPATRLWLPWGGRLSSHWSARGQRPGRLCPATGCQISWTTPSSHRFIPAFCTCGGYDDNFFFLILAVSPHATLLGI